MIGAIIGDIIGSKHEFIGASSYNFPLIVSFDKGENRFTDDTVLTIAMADSILNDVPYVDNLKKYYRLYPEKGYGMRFQSWAASEFTMPYNAYSNGAIMRTSPVGWAYDTEGEVLKMAKKFSAVTHNHEDSIKAAQCISYCIFKLRTGTSKADLLADITARFGYNIDFDPAPIILKPAFSIACKDIMPLALYAIFNNNDYESSVRMAICLDRDTDTIACIVGGVCEAAYGKVTVLPCEEILTNVLDAQLLPVVRQFVNKYMTQLNYKF